MDSACFTYEGVPILFNQTPCDYKPPVWILGKYYDGKYEGEQNILFFNFLHMKAKKIVMKFAFYCYLCSMLCFYLTINLKFLHLLTLTSSNVFFLKEIEKAVKSCLWFTYRKGFTPIGK